MNGWEHIPLKGVSGEERRCDYFCLQSLSVFATHTPSFIPPVVPFSLARPISLPHLNLTRLLALQTQSNNPDPDDCPVSEE